MLCCQMLRMAVAVLRIYGMYREVKEWLWKITFWLKMRVEHLDWKILVKIRSIIRNQKSFITCRMVYRAVISIWQSILRNTIQCRIRRSSNIAIFRGNNRKSQCRLQLTQFNLLMAWLDRGAQLIQPKAMNKSKVVFLGFGITKTILRHQV